MLQKIGLIFSLLGVLILPAFAQEEGKSTNIAFIIDASGSMNAEMEGGTRLTVAKEALTTLSAELPANANATVWAYGHRLPQDDPAASCQDIEELIPLSPSSEVDLAGVVSGINAIGYTPITRSLELAAGALPEGGRNIIVLLSDGEETCGGDPCAMAEALAQSGVDVQVNTIGLVVDEITRSQLQCIASVTGGTYFDATDSGLLLEALKGAAVVETGTILLVNEQGERLENLTFNGTNGATGEFIGGTGSADVPAGDYNLLIDTYPQQEATATVLTNEITEIVITSDGALQVVDLDGNPVPDMGFDVFRAESDEYLGLGVGTFNVQPGRYRVSVQTTPPTEVTVDVRAGEIVNVPMSATARVILEAPDGSIREDIYVQVLNPETQEFLGSYLGQTELVAGRYQLVVETVPMKIQNVTLRAGQTLRIPIVPEGTVVIQDNEGNALEEYFTVIAPESGEYITGAFSTQALLPGTYNITLDTNPPIDRIVTIKSGETFVVKIGAAGGIRLVDGTGNPLPELYFTLYLPNEETGGDYVTAGFGEVETQAGSYQVRPDVIGYLANLDSASVEVFDGQITEIVLPLGTAQIENLPASYGITVFYSDPPVLGTDENGYDLYGFPAAVPFPIIQGEYIIEIDNYETDTAPDFSQKFTVEAGQTLTIPYSE